MKEYYFLFTLAFIWTVFASIHDLKKREVANWLNFSLIAFALAYRAFYSIQINNYNFLILGVAGFGVYFVFAYALYYARAFAGGDAKLLMGYGAILPYSDYKTMVIVSLLFLLLIFLVGVGYSLLYSFYLATKNKNKFLKEFKRRIKNRKSALAISLAIFIFSFVLGFYNRIAFFFALAFFIPLIWTYTKSLDVCMIKLVSPDKLTEGDWLEKNVKLSNKKIIKKTVHGLSLEEIKLLRKYNKKVLIKEGIPFVPAFLLALLIMVFFFLVLGQTVESLFLFLF